MQGRSDQQAVEALYKFVLPDPHPHAPPRPVPAALRPARTGEAAAAPRSGPPAAAGRPGPPPSAARPGPPAAGAPAGAAPGSGGAGAAPQRVGRNDPCPCGSGLKYKKCHGA
jgi:preprotein translocase subunit SecA